MNNNSKIRFQHRNFRNRLTQARGYRRQAKAVSAFEYEGLAQLYRSIPHWVKLVTGAAVAFFIYFVYVPNPLYIKKIDIEGLNPRQTEQARALLSEYFASNVSQNNILLASKSKLVAHLIKKDSDILKVDRIKKSWWSKLAISVTPRINTFAITSPEGRFVLDNDFRVFSSQASTTASSSLPRIDIIAADVIHPGTVYESTEQLAAISYLLAELPKIIDSPIERFQIQNSKESDISVYTKDGAKYLFDYKTNLEEVLNKLRLLLASIAPQDAKRLAYVDLRIKNRSYVCLKGTACAKAPALPEGLTASTTSSTIDTLFK